MDVTHGLNEHATAYNQVADVLGHEVGHVDLYPGVRQIAKQRAASLGAGLGYVVLGHEPGQAETGALSIVAAAVFAKFSRAGDGLVDMFRILRQLQTQNPARSSNSSRRTP
jgi:predicted Zn-dependent protease